MAERKHSKAILDKQEVMEPAQEVRVGFEDYAHPFYWVAVVPTLLHGFPHTIMEMLLSHL